MWRSRRSILPRGHMPLEMDFKVSKHSAIPSVSSPSLSSFSLSTPLSVLCFYSQFELSASSPCYHTFFVLLRSPDTRGLLSPWNLKPKQTLRSVSCLGHDISPQQQKKVTNTDGLGSVGHLCGFHSRVPIKIAFIHAKYD